MSIEIDTIRVTRLYHESKYHAYAIGPNGDIYRFKDNKNKIAGSQVKAEADRAGVLDTKVTFSDFLIYIDQVTRKHEIRQKVGWSSRWELTAHSDLPELQELWALQTGSEHYGLIKERRKKS